MCVEDVGLMAVFSFHPAVQHPAETYSSSVFKFWESKIGLLLRIATFGKTVLCL